MRKSFFVHRYSFIVLALLLTLNTCFLILIPTLNPVFAQPRGCTGTPGGSDFECQAAGIIQIQQLITRLINISVTLAFTALTVWLVWSALKLFITSGGDPKALAHAWNSITWAFMGIFFLALAWFVMKLIFAVTGANVTQYCLGFPPYCL